MHDDYEKNVPELFVPNVFSVATEGKEYRYGAVGMPVDLWGPWRLEEEDALPAMAQVERAVGSMLRPGVVLDLLASFTAYATHKGKQRIKIIARYQQVDGVNKIVERVVAGQPRKGLIWHFQGSGKSLLMLFAARKLRLHPALRNPTVLVVVDRIDLDSQISGTFYAADMPNLVRTESRRELQDLLAKDVRKVIITTIHKFAEADGMLNDRGNIIVMVDEAHRTQEGDLGRKMRDALPNAFLFGLTGTPINRADKNTFYAFGADEDEGGYISRYGFEDSIRDGATKPLHFEPRLVELHIDQKAIEEAYRELTAGLTDEDRDRLGKAAAKMAVLVKSPERIARDLRRHRAALPGEGRPERLRRTGRHLRPSELRALQAGARPAPAAGSVGHRHVGEQRRGGIRALPPRSGRRGEAARPLPRPEGPAEDPHRHLEAPDRLRRADSPGDVSRQAAPGPHAAAGDLPDEPAVRRGEDPRPDRRLPRHLRRCGAGAAVRREGRPEGGLEHRRTRRQTARGDAEVPGVLRRLRPHPAGLRGAHRRAGVPAQPTTRATRSRPTSACSRASGRPCRPIRS